MNLETRLDISTLLLRLSMGSLLLAHSLLLKVGIYGVAGTVGYFESIGYPGLFAYLVIIGEALAGAALILGVYSRWAAVAMLPIMLGALAQHIGNGWVFSAQGGGWEFPALWTVLLVIQAVLGDGRYALIRVLQQRYPRLQPLLRYS